MEEDMTEGKSTGTLQTIPSVSWAWFHCGALDLLVSAVLLGIGIYSLVHQVFNPKESIVHFIIFALTVFVLAKIFEAKVQQKLFLRIPEANRELSKMEWVSGITIIAILLVPFLLKNFLEFDVLRMVGIASLMALLVGVIHSIRVKYYYFIGIAFIYCVLLIRSFLGDSFTTVLPASQAWVRYILAGLLFGTFSISRLVRFFKQYPLIEE